MPNRPRSERLRTVLEAVGAQPTLVAVEHFGHDLAISQGNEQESQRELIPSLLERAAWPKQRGDRRDQTGAFRPPGAVDQQRVLAPLENSDQLPQLKPGHPDAGRHRQIDLGCAGGEGGFALLPIPRLRWVWSAEIEHGLDAVSLDGPTEGRSGHLAGSVDPAWLEDGEIMVGLVPDDPSNRCRQDEQRQHHKPPDRPAKPRSHRSPPRPLAPTPARASAGSSRTPR